MVAMNYVDAYRFLAFSDLTSEAELGSSNQEASPSAD